MSCTKHATLQVYLYVFDCKRELHKIFNNNNHKSSLPKCLLRSNSENDVNSKLVKMEVIVHDAQYFTTLEVQSSLLMHIGLIHCHCTDILCTLNFSRKRKKRILQIFISLKSSFCHSWRMMLMIFCSRLAWIAQSCSSDCLPDCSFVV